MNSNFITKNFEQEISVVLTNIFPVLNNNDKTLLKKYLFEIIEYISVKFNFDLTKRDSYEDQFRQNNYRDIKGVLYMILPYINDEDESKKKKLKSLNELYILKKNSENINEVEPKYVYTNLQYGRCRRIKEGNTVIASEIQFNEQHLRDNMILLKDSIRSISNKLYVNWMDIKPISLLNYQDKELYKTTKNALDSNSLTDDTANDSKNKNYSGLFIGDIYNVISNDFYHSVKKIKWIIFDIKIGDRLLSYPDFFEEKGIKMQNFFDEISWNSLDINDQNSFKNSWEKLIQESKKGSSLTFLKTILIFFDKNYSRRKMNDALEEGYISLKTEKIDEDEFDFGLEEDEINSFEIDQNSLYKSLQSLPVHHLYDYILDSIKRIKNSIYYKKMEKKEKIENVTLKNLYNYSKSLVHYKENNKYLFYGKTWNSLTKEDKEEITKRINWDKNKDVTSWFNIGRYIKNLYGQNRSSSEVNQINNSIFKNIKENLTDLIFEALIYRGYLSEFLPNKHITDTSTYSTDYKLGIKQLKDRIRETLFNQNGLKKEWDDSYYFLTGEKYSDLYVTVLSRTTKREKTMMYLDYILSEDAPGTWYNFYAMNWISQIGFFHHYLNNRIIYVTGSTGVGKSSQIPKLLMYALKILDYNDTGKTVCTQPRTPPTEGNAKTISAQMGVPIKEYNQTVKSEIETNNYYIQFKHKKNSHISKDQNFRLEIVTDGTLYQMLKENPLLKEKFGRDSKNESYGANNTYDIVMVDEAHEHNKNMDLILTIMKYACYYNNSVKLVILSATMDEDEPVYRRYYRDINDNRMYPLNMRIKDDIVDRINVDRRFHISPPGESTRFRIDDYYRQNENPEELVLRIAKESNEGEILLFQPGKMEISKSVELLNKKLPSNMIALPYHGEMSGNKKDFIEDLNSATIYKFTVPKNVKYDSSYNESKIDKVSQGTYDRVVIVATNIAEASITIPSLKYVVDTGSQKIGRYLYSSRNMAIELVPISESSRIQRRGRVGRTGSGTVYYLYEEGKMEKNKSPFDISISNISDNLYDLLRDSSDEKELFNKSFDPNLNENLLLNQVPKKLQQFVDSQYFYKNIFYKYLGNGDNYDYSNRDLGRPHDFYETGYSKSVLEDRDGTFYIVHPDELCISRNILGIIVGETSYEGCDVEYEDHKIKSNKMLSFWEMLKEKLLLVGDDDLIKTEWGKRLMELKNKIEIETDLLISYLYSNIFGCNPEVQNIVPMITLLEGSLMRLTVSEFEGGRMIVKIKELKNLFGNRWGDLNGLVKITENYINFLERYGLLNRDKLSPKTISQFENQKRRYIEGKKTKNYEGIDVNYLEHLIKLDQKNRVVRSSKIEDYEKKELIKILPTIFSEENKNALKSWCDKNYLNADTMFYYLIEHSRFTDSIQKNQDLLAWFNEHLDVYQKSKIKEENINLSFIHGYSSNIVKQIEGKRYYVDTLYPSIRNIYVIKTVTRRAKIYSTLLESGFEGEYLLCLAKSEEDLSLINRVTPKMIQQTVPFVFSPSNMKSDKYSTNLDGDMKYLSEILKDDNILKDYKITVEKIRMDMLNNYEPNSWKIYMGLDPSSKFKHMINETKNREDLVKKSDINKSISGGGKPSYSRDLVNYNNKYIIHLLNKSMKYF